MSEALVRLYADKARQIYNSRGASNEFVWYGLLVSMVNELNGESTVSTGWLTSERNVREVFDVWLSRNSDNNPELMDDIREVMKCISLAIQAQRYVAATEPPPQEETKPWLKSLFGADALFKEYGIDRRDVHKQNKTAWIEKCTEQGLAYEDAEQMSIAALVLYAHGWRGE